MLISHGHKFVTIDIPKTGTRSFRETLVTVDGVVDIIGDADAETCFYQHAYASTVQKAFVRKRWKWNEYFKLTVVRNPWERWYSHFNYLKSQQRLMKCKDWQQLRTDVKHQIESANRFINRFDSDRQAFIHLVTNRPAQHEYFISESGDIIVDHIGCFTELQQTFDLLCNTCDITPSLKLNHANKGEYDVPMVDFYDQHMIDTVANHERYVIDLKNYQYVQ